MLNFLFGQEAFVAHAQDGGFGEEVKMRCRFLPGDAIRLSDSGFQPSGGATALFPAGADLRLGDRVTFAGEGYTLVEIRPAMTPSGVHHLEARLI